MKKTIIAALVVTLVPGAVFAHSGGTDANGCHAGSQPYHCHNSGSSSSENSDVPVEAMAVVLIVWAVWYCCLRKDGSNYAFDLSSSTRSSQAPALSVTRQAEEDVIAAGFRYEF